MSNLSNRDDKGNRTNVPSKRLKAAHRATRILKKDAEGKTVGWSYPQPFRVWLRGPQTSPLMEARDEWKRNKRDLKKGA